MKPKTDSNTASLAVVGVDIGKEVFHIVGFGVDGKICVPEKDQAIGSRRRVPEAVTLHCWNGSVLERPFCQQSAPRIRTRAADHPGYLRQAVHQGAEERL